MKSGGVARRSPSARSVARRSRPIAGPAATLCDIAYSALKRRIVTNQLAAGATIADLEVAGELGMSRTPVREALLRLRDEGFVEVRPRKEIRVLPIGLEELHDTYDLLTALEIHAVQRLAERRPAAAELAPLEAAIRDMTIALRREDAGAWTDADERFHRGLLTLCGNTAIARVGLAARDRIQRAHVIALRMRPRPERSVREHAGLVRLIRAGRVDAARTRHLAQRRRAGEELVRLLEQAGLRQL